MLTPPLVGLVGKKRVGKDTAALALVERRGFVRVAFADPLKAAALDLDPLVEYAGNLTTGRLLPVEGGGWPTRYGRLSEIVDAVGWEVAKDLVPEARGTLQRLGTAMRNLDRDVWVRPAMEAVRLLRTGAPRVPGVPVVVTDVRMPNEAAAIVRAGGTLVRIVRPSLTHADEHESETALDDYPTTYTIETDDVEDLRSAIVALVG